MSWVIIGSCNGFSPVRRQTIIWTNAGLFSIGLQGTNFSEIWIAILLVSFKNEFENVVCHNEGFLSRGRWVLIIFLGFTPVDPWGLKLYCVTTVNVITGKRGRCVRPSDEKPVSNSVAVKRTMKGIKLQILNCFCVTGSSIRYIHILSPV